MASLLGKADATIAGMSYKEAMADVMPDYSDIYKQKAESFDENLSTFQKTVEDYFENLYADNNALADDLKEAVSITMANMSAGATPDEEGMELFNSHLEGLSQRLRNTPKTKKGQLERAKIRAEMERLKNSTSGMSETMIDLGVRIENGDFIANATGNENMQILKAINDKTAKREIINGDLVYSIPGSDKKITQHDLKKMLVSNDPEINKAINTVTVSAGALGKTKGVKWDDERQGIVNGYKESFSTKEGLAANMHKAQGTLKYSYAEYLSGKGDKKYNMQIWNALKEAGVDVPKDKNGDGKITEKDFATPENGIAMIKQLTQISNEGFDFAIAKQVASEFLTDNVAFKEFNDGKSLRTPVPGKTDGIKTDTNPYGLSLSKKGKYGLGLPSKGTSYVPQYDATYVTNKVDNLKSGSRIDFQGDNYTFREVDGVTQWWKNYGYGDDYGKKVEGVGIGTPVGTAKDMAEDVFFVGDDPIFNSIVTEREQEVPDDKTGLLPSDNQFADRQAVAEGQGKAAVVPTDFVDVFKKDFQSDLEVVKYLKNMNVPGLVVGTYQGNPDYNYPNNDNRKLVTASDTAYDDIIVTLNGKTKLFTTDPSFSGDTEGAQEIWNWLYDNFSGTKASVNNDYYNLIDKDN